MLPLLPENVDIIRHGSVKAKFFYCIYIQGRIAERRRCAGIKNEYAGINLQIGSAWAQPSAECIRSDDLLFHSEISRCFFEDMPGETGGSIDFVAICFIMEIFLHRLTGSGEKGIHRKRLDVLKNQLKCTFYSIWNHCFISEGSWERKLFAIV